MIRQCGDSRSIRGRPRHSLQDSLAHCMMCKGHGDRPGLLAGPNSAREWLAAHVPSQASQDPSTRLLHVVLRASRGLQSPSSLLRVVRRSLALRIWRWRVSADGRSSEKLERLTARRTVAQDLVASKQRSAWVLFKPLVFVYSAPGHTRQIASRLTNGRLARRRYGGRTKLRVLFQGGTVQLCRWYRCGHSATRAFCRYALERSHMPALRGCNYRSGQRPIVALAVRA